MTSLRAFEYGNPEDVLIRRQEEAASKEKACGQCRERVSFHWKGKEIIECGLKHQHYGRRCEHYMKKRDICSDS